jgi:hypothetical protein
VPEDQEPFPHLIAWFLALLGELLLQDRELHFELVDAVFEEEDLSGFRVDVPAGQTVEVSLTHPPRESRREEGGFDEERDRGVEDLEILCHASSSKAS